MVTPIVVEIAPDRAGDVCARDDFLVGLDLVCPGQDEVSSSVNVAANASNNVRVALVAGLVCALLMAIGVTASATANAYQSRAAVVGVEELPPILYTAIDGHRPTSRARLSTVSRSPHSRRRLIRWRASTKRNRCSRSPTRLRRTSRLGCTEALTSGPR